MFFFVAYRRMVHSAPASVFVEVAAELLILLLRAAVHDLLRVLPLSVQNVERLLVLCLLPVITVLHLDKYVWAIHIENQALQVKPEHLKVIVDSLHLDRADRSREQQNWYLLAFPGVVYAPERFWD